MKTISLFLSLLLALPAYPCTRVLSESSNQDVIVGRNMDWVEDIGTNMWQFPRGMARNGLAGENSLKWTSKYGSVILSAYDVGTTDGINEKGLNANVLYLTEANFGVRDEKLLPDEIGLRRFIQRPELFMRHLQSTKPFGNEIVISQQFVNAHH